MDFWSFLNCFWLWVVVQSTRICCRTWISWREVSTSFLYNFSHSTQFILLFVYVPLPFCSLCLFPSILYLVRPLLPTKPMCVSVWILFPFKFLFHVSFFVCFIFHFIPFFSVYLFNTDSNAGQREDKTCGDINRKTKSRWYRNKGSEKGKWKPKKNKFCVEKKNTSKNTFIAAFLYGIHMKRFFSAFSSYLSILLNATFSRSISCSATHKHLRHTKKREAKKKSRTTETTFKRTKQQKTLNRISCVCVRYCVLCNLFLLVLLLSCSCLNFNLSIVCLLLCFLLPFKSILFSFFPRICSFFSHIKK